MTNNDKERIALPYAVVFVGLVVVLLGAGLRIAGSPQAAAFVLFLGLTVIGAAVTLGYRRWRHESLPICALWLLAAVGCAGSGVILGRAWDSMAFFCTVAAAVASLAALVTAMPVRWRKFAISAVILFHFAAMASGVLVVPPPNGPAPFVPTQGWVRYARPYLQFFNINNAYHFYAPDPGPTVLLWFRLEYADGASKWVRWPDHAMMTSHIERRRYGSLATSVSQIGMIPPEALERRLEERKKAAPPEGFIPQHGLDARPDQIPFGPMVETGQYREPTLDAKMLIAGYAKYVARTTPHPKGENHAVKGVKIYRVDYHNPPVEHFQAGRDPLDPTLYMAFYQGEFDAEGRLKPTSLRMTFNKNGEMETREQDPLLYWLIPIVKVISNEEADKLPRGSDGRPDVWAAEGKIVNFVRIHAGDPTEESIP